MSFDDTYNDINDIVLVILKPRSLTGAATLKFSLMGRYIRVFGMKCGDSSYDYGTFEVT